MSCEIWISRCLPEGALSRQNWRRVLCTIFTWARTSCLEMVLQQNFSEITIKLVFEGEFRNMNSDFHVSQSNIQREATKRALCHVKFEYQIFCPKSRQKWRRVLCTIYLPNFQFLKRQAPAVNRQPGFRRKDPQGRELAMLGPAVNRQPGLRQCFNRF